MRTIKLSGQDFDFIEKHLKGLSIPNYSNQALDFCAELDRLISLYRNKVICFYSLVRKYERIIGRISDQMINVGTYNTILAREFFEFVSRKLFS